MSFQEELNKITDDILCPVKLLKDDNDALRALLKEAVEALELLIRDAQENWATYGDRWDGIVTQEYHDMIKCANTALANAKAALEGK